MNPLQRRSFLGLGLGLVGAKSLLNETTVAAAPPAAGAAPAGKGKGFVEFKKPEITNQKAPDFTLKGGAVEKRFKPKEWLEIEFELEVKAPNDAPKDIKFLDNLVVKYFVFLTPADVNKRKLLTAEITYLNVPVGHDTQHGVVYISPASLLNLTGDKIVDKRMITYLGAEATYNGQVVGVYSSPGAPVTAGGGNWWTNPKAPPVETGRLLPKSKTPFAPLWYDYYLEEKADK